MALLFLFVDGIGLAESSPHNPFSVLSLEGFERLTSGQQLVSESEPVVEDEQLFVPVDANLGVEGLPQSGTGQAALFSGVNAPKIIDRHFGPFPHSQTKQLLNEESLFQKAQECGQSCHFLNAYPDIFFEKMAARNRWTCTTLMATEAGLELNGEEAVKTGHAITAEITQQAWRERLGIDIPSIPPEESSKRALSAMEAYDLVLFEYYLTDKAGHTQEESFAEQVLQIFDRFLAGILDGMSAGTDHSLVLCSDHGNLEDLSRKTHTRNPVPLLAKGPVAAHLAEARSITDVTPGIIRYLEETIS